MNLDDARSAVILALGRMNTLYQQPVFDEWMLVKLTASQDAILAYQGPRAESYKGKFKADIGPLRTELEQRRLAVGDFGFAPDAKGTGFDACIRLGPAGYLFCNNTAKSMGDIRQNPLWLAAQKAFVDLSAIFRSNPLD
jgi:hypothetical protein